MGSYDASYSRHRILQKGLRELGYVVTETRDQSFLPLRWVRLCLALLRVPRDIPVIVGEASNYLAPVIAFGRLQGRRVIFDSFVSLMEIHGDHRAGLTGRLWRAIGGLLDRVNCGLATVVLADTVANREFFAKDLGVSRSKIKVVYVGAESDLFIPQELPESANQPLSILFYGSFLPLHGIGTILEAAGLLQEQGVPVRFRIVGQGIERPRMRSLAATLELTNVDFGPDHIPYELLPDWIAASDVCLGVFGTTAQASRVIPNKVFQAAACGRPVVTADTPGVREVFSGDTVFLVPPGDPNSLAEAIVSLMDPALRSAMAGRASALVQSRFGHVAIASQFLNWSSLA